jgi:hypothetical protein
MKRYCINVSIHDEKTGEHIEKSFLAERKLGAWKKVLEEVLPHVTPRQLMTFLKKRKDLGFGASKVLDCIFVLDDDKELLEA